jgi:hypothetical protein
MANSFLAMTYRRLKKDILVEVEDLLEPSISISK